MSIKKLVLLMGLCVLFAGCSTKGSFGDTLQTPNETPTHKGIRYLLGRGVEQNDEKAFYFFSQAARDEDPFAENELGYMYAAGKGTPRDYNKSFKWYQKAAKQGLASAQYNLALLYLHGLGTPVNKSQAHHWLQKSAAHGFEPAKIALARAS